MYQAHTALELGETQSAHALAETGAAYLLTASALDRTRAQLCLACTHYGLGHMDAALTLFEQVSASVESPTARLNAGECAARTLVMQGRLRAAAKAAADLIAGARVGNAYNVLVAGAFVTLGEVAYQQNLLDQVPIVVQQGIELADRLAPRAPVRAHQVWAYLRLARVRQVQGDAEGVAEALRQSDAIAEEIGNAFYLRLAEIRRKAEAAAQDAPMAGQVRVCMPVAFACLGEYETWIAVHLAAAQGRPQTALALLDPMLASARQNTRALAVIEMLVWRALLCQRLGRTAESRTAITEALSLGAPEGCLRVFLDTGAEVVPLLKVIRPVAPVHVDRLLAEFGGDGRPAPDADRPPHGASADDARWDLALDLEPLSERELEILNLVAAGLSNQEIGQRLFIGVGTVKWYLNNLYGKLEVRSRTQAVARARGLGLVA
jgi:LuxR family maltose regulon positive regulatory protein